MPIDKIWFMQYNQKRKIFITILVNKRRDCHNCTQRKN